MTEFWDDDEDPGCVSEVEDERERPGCVFPGRCLMPGLHYPSECHTVEMIEAIEAEALSGGEAA